MINGTRLVDERCIGHHLGRYKIVVTFGPTIVQVVSSPRKANFCVSMGGRKFSTEKIWL